MDRFFLFFIRERGQYRVKSSRVSTAAEQIVDLYLLYIVGRYEYEKNRKRRLCPLVHVSLAKIKLAQCFIIKNVTTKI